MTTHETTATPDRTADWKEGISFTEFLPTAEKNVGLWTSTYERASIPEAIVARVEQAPGSWKLLVLSEDWCGDASNTVPVIARLAEAADNLEMRLLARDEHLPLMDQHLTGAKKSRSIPVAILLDETNTERAWWGPRPADLQRWVMTEGMEMEPPVRYREVRKWYARDKGRATLREVVAMIEAAAAATSVG